MCGLVGIAGDVGVKDEQIFKNMLDVCQVRGRHSTGAINVDRQNRYTWAKQVGPPSNLFDCRHFDANIIRPTHAALIGHCRHKTVGEIDRKSAHPFDIEEHNIIGVHNGTLRSYNKLDGYDFKKVDSLVLYEHLAVNGPENTFNEIEGAWACVWWDGNKNTLNFIRNSQRPLFLTWSKDQKKMFWASEEWMFGVVERDVHLWEGTEKVGPYIELPTNELWSFEINANAPGATIKMKPAVKIPEKKVVTSRTTSSASVGNSNHGQPWHLWNAKKKTPEEIWDQKTSKTHKWCNTTRSWVPRMSREEFVKQETKGGEVSNPFQPSLLTSPESREKKPILGLIQGGKNSTDGSTSKSGKASTNGSDPSTHSTPMTIGSPTQTSEPLNGSSDNQKTNKRKSSNEPSQQQKSSSATLQNRRLKSGVSLRSIAGMMYVTDNKTGNEYSEQQVDENTAGVCSFCNTPIGSLSEVGEFFGREKFVCTDCLQAPTQEKIVQLIGV